MKWFNSPYKSGRLMGIPYVKELLPPAIKWVFDTLNHFKGSYIGIADDKAFLYIDNQPPIRVRAISIDEVKELCDDVKVYDDLNEYRISPGRAKAILIYYS